MGAGICWAKWVTCGNPDLPSMRYGTYSAYKSFFCADVYVVQEEMSARQVSVVMATSSAKTRRLSGTRAWSVQRERADVSRV
jgi:hypothetical protein